MGARGYLTFLVVGVMLAVPASASALTLCVNRAGPECQQTYDRDNLQTALNFADSAAAGGADRILIGAGLYDDGPYLADGDNQVEIVGAGPAATTLSKVSGNDQTVLTVDQAASTVEGLGIEVGNGSNPTGLSLRNSATNIRVVEVPSATGSKTGVRFTAAGALVDSTVSLDVNTGTIAVNAQLVGSAAELTLQNNDLQGALGVFYETPLHTERNRITARTGGIFGTGALDIDNAAIRMLGNGGPNAAAVFAGSTQAGLLVQTGNLTAQHLTAFGPGAGSGVVIGAGCKPDGASVAPNPASGQVRDTVIDGFANDFFVAGTSCPDPINPPFPKLSQASLDVDYSIFDPATIRTNPPASVNQGSKNRTGDPLLVDAAAGNLRLSQASPAVDAGQSTPAAGDERDVAGNPRVQDGDGDGVAVRDMGAFEHTFDPSSAGGGGGDGDGNGVPSPGGGEITRTLTLGYKAKKDSFRGAIKSNEAACLAGKVKVFEKAKGRDPKAGADKTNAAGKWSFKDKGADGKFYATVAAKTVPAGACPAAKSRAKKVG